MMNDKQLLQMLENLGKNSRIARSSKSLAASEVVTNGDEYRNREGDTRCAKTIRDIITSHYGLGTNTNTNTKSLAAAAPTSRAAANPNVNRVKTLYNFVIKNHNL